MAIYTKRGDRGETSLYDINSSQKIRISKSSLKINAIGTIDELNSYLGVVASASNKDVVKLLADIQENLFIIGSILAGAKLRFPKSKTKKLEMEIDKLETVLPLLKNFILPGGSNLGANLHYSRTLVRRAERSVVALSEVETVRSEVLSYINRLSDFLFMLARMVNRDTGFIEKVWKAKFK